MFSIFYLLLEFTFIINKFLNSPTEEKYAATAGAEYFIAAKRNKKTLRFPRCIQNCLFA